MKTTKPYLTSLRLVAALIAALTLASFSARAANLTWDANAATALQTDGAGAWLTVVSNVWWDGAANVTWTSGSDAIFGNGGVGGAVTLASPTTVNSLTFNSFITTAYTLGTAAQTITLTNGITMNAGATNVTFVSPLTLGAPQTWANNSGGTLGFSAAGVNLNGNALTIGGSGSTSFDGNVANVISGAGGIVKNGSGNLTLDGATAITHNFTGGITITGSGRVGAQTGGNLTGRGNVSINGGYLGARFTTTVTFAGGLGTGTTAIQILGGTSGFSGEGSSGSTFTIGTAASVLKWGATGENGASGFFNPSVLLLNGTQSMNSNGKGTLANGIDLNGTSRTITSSQVTDGAAGSGFTVSGTIVNTAGTAAGFEKTGVGNLILSSTGNTYDGATTISGGWITAAGSGSIGNGLANNTLIFNGGTLRATAAITSPSTRGVTMTQTGIIDNNGQAISFAGNIGGAGGLTKNGTGTLTLSGTDTYGGTTTVNAGTLAIANQAALYNATPANWTAANINLKTGTTLQLNVDSAGSAGFTSANLSTLLGNISVANTAAQGLQAGVTLALDTTTASGATFTQGNAITDSTGAFGGALSLTKLGTGTLVLDKANTYTGLTTISAGTLQLNDGGVIPGAIINNGIFLVNKTGTLTIGTDFPATFVGSGSIASGAGSTITISTPTALQFNALNTTGGGSFALSGVIAPIFGGLSGTAGNLSSAFSSGYSSVTNLTLNVPTGNTFTYGGVINDGAAGMSVTKTGAGTQVLTNNNTYTGVTFLNAGTLTVGSGSTIGKISGTTGLTFNGGTLQFNRSGTTDVDAFPNSAPVTVNSSSTFGATSADAGGVNANETIGAVTLNAGQMNFNWSNGGSSGTQVILTSLSRSGTASANFNSGFAANSSRWKVTGAGTTTANQIIGPWYTTGGGNAGFASTDYAVYASDFVAQAAIAGSAETTWTTPANAYTTSAGGTVTLTGTRTITALRNTGTGTILTLASGANLETYGLLNGVATTLTNLPGTGGVLTTPSGSGNTNLYLNAGAGAILINAPINDNGVTVTLVKNGANTLTLNSTTSTYSGGTVINAGTVAITNDLNLGTAGTGITFNGSATLADNVSTTLVDLGTRAITLNNGAMATFSAIAGRSDMAIGGAVTGSGGVTHLGVANWAKLRLNSTANTFTGPLNITIPNDDGVGGNVNSFFYINSIADGPGYGAITLNIGSASNPSGFDYGTGGANGAGGGGAIVPLVLNNRQILVASANANLINNSSAQALTINTDLGFSGTGARSIRFGFLSRAGSGISTFNGKLTDNVGGALTPTFGGGTWVLSGANTYTGPTTISAGMLSISAIDVVANANPLGKSSAAAANLLLANGTTLQYTGPAASSDRSFTINGTAAGHSATLDASGTGALNLTSTATPGYGTAAQTRTLTLAGTNSNLNTLAATLTNNTSGALSLVKSGTGTWRLTGANLFTGNATINAGALEAIDGTGLPTASILQIRGGVLQGSGTFSRSLGTAAGNIGWATSSGGFAARGGTYNIQLNGGTASVTWNGTSFVDVNNTLIFGSSSADSMVNFQNALNLGSSSAGLRTIQVDDNPNSSGDFARMSGVIGNTAAGWGILKTGAGRLELANVNTYTGSNVLSAGTLALGINNALPTTSVTMGNATLDAATFINNLGFLRVTNTATINLGSGGALAFADSSAASWSGGTLNITGTFVSGSSLRFGTSSSGLTGGQLAQISRAGVGSFSLDVNGYLVACFLPTASALSITNNAGVAYNLQFTNLTANVAGVGVSAIDATTSGGKTLTKDGGYTMVNIPNTVTNGETFSYSLTNACGPASGLVTVYIVNSYGTAANTITNLGGGLVGLTFYGQPSTTYHIQRGTNVNFTGNTTLILAPTDSNGVILTNDTPGVDAYYRLQYP